MDRTRSDAPDDVQQYVATPRADEHDEHEARTDGHGEQSGHEDHEGHGGGGHDGHAEMFRRRFWVTLALSVPVVFLSEMVAMWLGYELPEALLVQLVAPVLGTVVFVYGGRVFLVEGWGEARRREPGMMLLIAMAISVAFLASLATEFGLVDLDFWWELAALVSVMLLGHWQEMRAIGQARGALQALAELLPDDAERVTEDGETETVSVADLQPGDVVLVRPGARVPADVTIVDGAGAFDESMLTGESNPVEHDEGDEVVAGSVSVEDAVRVRVDQVGDDTALAGIQRMV